LAPTTQNNTESVALEPQIQLQGTVCGSDGIQGSWENSSLWLGTAGEPCLLKVIPVTHTKQDRDSWAEMAPGRTLPHFFNWPK